MSAVKHESVNHRRKVGKATEDANARRADLEGQGFKLEKSEGGKSDLGGEKHHYAHPDGSRAVVTHSESQFGEHVVNSHVNTMNKGAAGRLTR